jgi:hypothetical protein
MPNGEAWLDIKPDGLNWQWAQVQPDRAREALAVALTAIDGRWKLYISLPDDQESNLLEIVGISKTPDQPEPLVLYRGEAGIGGYDLAETRDRALAFDFNSSGKLDHLVFYRPGGRTIWFLRNDGGTFTAINRGETILGNYDLADNRDRVFAFDYNSSGRLDHLVFYRPGPGDCRIFRNNGGTFTPVYTGMGIGGYDLFDDRDRGFAFDYTGNGRLDHLVFYRPGTETIWVLRNNAGTFEQANNGASILANYDLADNRDRAFPFDYNSSGNLDHLVLYRAGNGDCRIFRNNDTVFTPVYSGMGIGGYDLFGNTDDGFAFDFNNVGKLDHLVFYRPGETYFWILRNTGGTFNSLPGYNGSGVRGYDFADPRDRAFAFDYNSNGRLDNIVVYRPGTGRIWILNSLN